MAEVVAYAKLKQKLLRPAMTSHYEVIINDSTDLYRRIQQRMGSIIQTSPGQSGQDLVDTLKISCCDAVMPGSTFFTHEIQNDRTGVTEKIPYRRVYDDEITCSFYVDCDYTSLIFFEAWMQVIANEQSPVLKETTGFYRMPYPNEAKYRTKIELFKFEKDYKDAARNPVNPNQPNQNTRASKELKYTFLDAYPVSITSIPISYDTSALLKVSVSFSFLRYYLN